MAWHHVIWIHCVNSLTCVSKWFSFWWIKQTVYDSRRITISYCPCSSSSSSSSSWALTSSSTSSFSIHCFVVDFVFLLIFAHFKYHFALCVCVVGKSEWRMPLDECRKIDTIMFEKRTNTWHISWMLAFSLRWHGI